METLSNIDKSQLGREITSWIYKRQRSNKFLIAVFSVIGALIVFTMLYGEQLLPWIRHIPAIWIYAAFFLISPLLTWLNKLGRDQEWALYEKGYLLTFLGKNNSREELIGHWRDYRTCSYDKNGVKLVPVNALKKTLKMNTSRNAMEIYSICRERISIAQAERLEVSAPRPQIPQTREQQNLRRAEQKAKKAFQPRQQDIGFDFKKLFDI